MKQTTETQDGYKETQTNNKGTQKDNKKMPNDDKGTFILGGFGPSWRGWGPFTQGDILESQL